MKRLKRLFKEKRISNSTIKNNGRQTVRAHLVTELFVDHARIFHSRFGLTRDCWNFVLEWKRSVTKMVQPIVRQKDSRFQSREFLVSRNVNKISKIGYWSIPWIAEDGIESVYTLFCAMKIGGKSLEPGC